MSDVFGFAVGAAGEFLKDAAVDAGYELGLFATVASPRSLGELAVGVSARRLRPLLDLLVALGALRRVDGGFLAGVAPPRPVVVRAGWGLMADVIRRDQPLTVDGGDVEQRYHLHLCEIGRAPGAELAQLLPDGSLIDLGGGAGTYTRAYLEAHPEGRATIVDCFDVLVLARAALADHRERVTFAGGDLAMVTTGEHDAALLSNVTHLHAPAFAARFVAAAVRYVKPGGVVAIKDLRLDDDRSGPMSSLLFALNMAIYTGGGDVYPTSQLRAWMAEAGLVEIEAHPLASSPDSIVLIGRRPRLPRPLREMMARAKHVAPEIAPALDAHYLELMPRMRDAQVQCEPRPESAAGPAAGDALLHTRLDWRRLPRLTAAIDRLFEVLHDCHVPGVVGAATPGALREQSPTLATLYARTHYGGCMPLLYGYPADLAYFASRGLDTHATIDRYLTAPIVHELCHLAPERDALPPHLDECIAGWLAVHVWPEFAYPEAGHDDAIYAAPWLSQIGQAYVRAFGIAPIVRAHAGTVAWNVALPPAFVEQLTRACHDDWARRRTLHFLSDTFDPDPWVALALARPLADDPEFDLAIVEHALRAMCLLNAQVGGSFRARTRVPEAAIEIDAVAGRVTTPISGELDRIAPRYWLPPAVAGAIRARGHTGYALWLGTTEAIPAAARTLCTGVAPSNFVIVPREIGDTER